MYVPKCVPTSFLHLICRHPILVVPIAIGLLLGIPHFMNVPSCCVPEAMITFTFDDGYLSTYQYAYPILKKYGYVGTAFIIPSLVGKEGYMNWAQITELYRNGWEIGSHSYTHPHLTQLSLEDLEKELYLSKQDLERHGFYVISFASPYGEWDEKTIVAIKKYYLLHRTAWPSDLNPIPLPEKDRYYLKAVAADEISVEEVKQWIRKAKEEKKWLILIFHRVNEHKPQYNISAEDFEEIVKFVHDLGFKGIRFNDLFTQAP